MTSIEKESNKKSKKHNSSEEYQKYESLFDLAYILGQQNDFDEALRLVTEKLTSLFKADILSISMLNPLTRDTIKTIIRDVKEYNQKKFKFVQDQMIGWVLLHKQPFFSADLQTDPRFSKKPFQKFPDYAAMCIPLRVEGEVFGVIVVLKYENSFSEHEFTILKKCSVIVAPYLRNIQNLQKYFEVKLPLSALTRRFESVGMIGKCKKYLELLRATEAAARCDVRVLLEGQTGTGKEFIARAIHNFSERNDKPFVTIDCGAIPENLVESELFGRVKGAFTGANFSRKGLFAEADGGTLFMDEIANLSLAMQAKLMRVLQESEIRPIGSNKTINVDVRTIIASSASLQELVTAGKFREDLFYRLNIYPIYIPSLHERQDDIPLLANHFLQKKTKQQKKSAASFHVDILDYMRHHHWPGNIRELENFVERLVTFVPLDSPVIGLDNLPPDLLRIIKSSHLNHTGIKSLPERVLEFEAQIITQALIENNWNQSRAARVLNVAEGTIRHKIKKLNIEKPVCVDV